MNAIMEALPDDTPMLSRYLVEDVSKLSGKNVSPITIGHHMMMLEEEGKVRRLGTRSTRTWRKTWYGGSRPSE